MAPTGSSKFTPEYLASLSPEYLAEDIGYRLINVVITFIVLETVFIVLFYASRYVNKTVSGIECWLLMPLSYIFCIAICAIGILIVHHGGAGRHVEAVLLDDPNIIVTRSKIDKALEYIYAFSLAPAKLAILCLYLRIFTTRRYRIAAYVVAGLVVATLITSFILSSTMCQPFAAHWDHTIPGGKCLDIMDVYTWISVPNIVTDVIMLVLPLPAIYKLQVGRAAKIGILLTFLAGSLGLITSILRLVEFQNAADLFKDPTYKCIPTFTFTIIEPGVYMIAACMPTLRPLKRRVMKNFSISSAITSIFDKSMGRTTKGSSIAKSSKVGAFQSSDVQLNSYKSDGQNSFSQHSVSESKGGFIRLDDNNCQFVTPLSEDGTVRREQRGPGV